MTGVQTCALPISIIFSWHGGEPTLLGLEYFRNIVSIQRQHVPPGRRIQNVVQTNGVLLDKEWCSFFRQEHFGVGLSLDGPPWAHDPYRVTSAGQGTHAQCMRAFELLRSYAIPFDILCALHDRNVGRPLDVYRFLRGIGAQSVAFLPIVEPLRGAETGVSPQTVKSDAWGTFLCTVFEEWSARDTRRMIVQIFEEASRPLRGLEHSLCIFRETCGQLPVIEHNGDFYSCDHFVDSTHRLGNILDTPLLGLLESPALVAFGQMKKDSLPRCCRACEVLSMCNGGCLKDRFIRAPDGEFALNYLCAGFKAFFTFCKPRLMRMLSKTQGGSQVELPPRGPIRRGRNDPCPCGSGRKYKRCCM